MFKGGYILGGVDYGSVTYSGEEGGIFWRDGWGSGKVAYLRREGIFREGGIHSGICRKGGIF